MLSLGLLSLSYEEVTEKHDALRPHTLQSGRPHRYRSKGPARITQNLPVMPWLEELGPSPPLGSTADLLLEMKAD